MQYLPYEVRRSECLRLRWPNGLPCSMDQYVSTLTALFAFRLLAAILPIAISVLIHEILHAGQKGLSKETGSRTARQRGT